MGPLDPELRGAVTRYVASYHTRKKHDELSRAVSGVLWIRLWIVCLVLLMSEGVAALLPHLVAIAISLQTAARWALLLTVANLAIALSFGVFGAVRAALHRFDWLSSASIVQAIARAAGAVALLRAKHGIMALWGVEEKLRRLLSDFDFESLGAMIGEVKAESDLPRCKALGRLYGRLSNSLKRQSKVSSG